MCCQYFHTVCDLPFDFLNGVLANIFDFLSLLNLAHASFPTATFLNSVFSPYSWLNVFSSLLLSLFISTSHFSDMLWLSGLYTNLLTCICDSYGGVPSDLPKNLLQRA